MDKPVSEEKKQINLPRIKLAKPDWSKINLRKFNWATVMAVFAYLHVLVFVSLIWNRKKANGFVAFHARQGFVLLFVWLLFAYSLYLPLIPWFFLLYLIVSIIGGIVSVVRGQEKELLFVGKKVRLAGEQQSVSW